MHPPVQPDSNIDFLIVGAGFAGLVTAERLAAAGWKCVVIDRRDHIAGNAHDTTDAAGVLIHPYGPHYFRTNAPRVVDFLSRFTEWNHVEYKIKSFTDGRYWSFPINLNTFEEWLGRPSSTEEFAAWLAANREPVEVPQNSEQVIVSQIGRALYQKFFEGYTLKQWQRHPRDLDPSVCGRIPLRVNRDDRYLRETFQALPKDGYTAMFGRMIDASPGLRVHLKTEFAEASRRWRWRHLVYTGPLDGYFHCCHGPLPWRSLRFEPESFTAEQLIGREPVAGKQGFWQPAMQVNYPDAAVPFTRIVEIKHATGQRIDATTIVREFPMAWRPGDEPFYPVPADDAKAIYQKYAGLAAREERVSFIGRLATYRYYNMDQVTAMALAEADKLVARYGSR
jgi:UDP-galactopyranose mutase